VTAASLTIIGFVLSIFLIGGVAYLFEQLNKRKIAKAEESKVTPEGPKDSPLTFQLLKKKGLTYYDFLVLYDSLLLAERITNWGRHDREMVRIVLQKVVTVMSSQEVDLDLLEDYDPFSFRPTHPQAPADELVPAAEEPK